MFAIAILAGIYSYLLFGLGLLGQLNKVSILTVTILFISSALLYFQKKPEDFPRFNLKNKKIKPFVFLFGILMAVNLVGVFSPELSFDALWYHLTIPKIFLENQSISYIPGGLFYYSAMPKLGEMLYLPSIALNTVILAKLIHFSFGVLASLVVYRIARKFTDEKFSVLASLMFYGSLVVAWESTISYIDLTRTFFESLAVLGVLNYFEKRDKKWILESGVMMGLAISTKLIALGSLPVFFLILLFFEKEKITAFKNASVFVFTALLISFPWFFFAFIATGNPIYPLFSESYSVGINFNLLNPINLVKDLLTLFLRADDPISPIYAIVLPVLILKYKKFNKEQKIIAVFCLLAVVVWYITPRTGGGRFILPYLPAFSVLAIILISSIKNISLRKYLSALIIIVFLSTIVFRGLANLRNIPVILRIQSKDEYMSQKLNFKYGDFYDTDGFFRENIKNTDVVLLYGFHNLYYANFPFIHESYVKKGDRFNYIATQNEDLPQRFSHWDLVHQNDKTNVSVYKYGGMKWSY